MSSSRGDELGTGASPYSSARFATTGGRYVESDAESAGQRTPKTPASRSDNSERNTPIGSGR